MLGGAMQDAYLLSLATSDPYALGEAVLALAHQAFFQRYVEESSGLDSAILDGEYNCVSSSAVYLLLAKAAGLNASGVVTRDHSFVSLDLGAGASVDVETTNPHGFDPGSKKEFLDSFGRVTGYAYVPPSDTQSRRPVDARHIVGLIAWNEATLAEREADYLRALSLAADAYAWMGDDEARRYLGERAHNAAAFFLNSGRMDQGIQFITRVMERYGELADLLWLLDQARVARLAKLLADLPPADALAELEAARDGGYLPPDDADAMLGYVYGRLAEEAKRAEGWLGAWRTVERGALGWPGSPSLASLLKTVKSNWVAERHNAFAALFNARRYQEALAAITEALAILPDERVFLNDQATVQKVLGDH
ncbi:MAG: hypothetical protein JW923_08850 [Spirochaetales bacterium]|nr:hypothetical protein [Spirochaetales bacterium]